MKLCHEHYFLDEVILGEQALIKCLLYAMLCHIRSQNLHYYHIEMKMLTIGKTQVYGFAE